MTEKKGKYEKEEEKQPVAEEEKGAYWVTKHVLNLSNSEYTSRGIHAGSK